MENEKVHFSIFTFPLRSAFLALPLEDEAKQQFQEIQRKLEPFAGMFRFQNQQSPHLTLYFWKELLEIEYHDVISKIENIASLIDPFLLTINGVDTFGKSGEERVLFLVVAFSPELAKLKKLCPWPNPPGQPFHPHITIAHIVHPQKFAVHKKKIMKLLDAISFGMQASSLRFYAEVEGRKQVPLRDFSLLSS